MAGHAHVVADLGIQVLMSNGKRLVALSIHRCADLQVLSLHVLEKLVAVR